jgi:hypothetical protein
MKNASIGLFAFWMLVGPPGYATKIYSTEAACMAVLQKDYPGDNRYSCNPNHPPPPSQPKQ